MCTNTVYMDLIGNNQKLAHCDIFVDQLQKASRGSPVLASTAALMSAAMRSVPWASVVYGTVTTAP